MRSQRLAPAGHKVVAAGVNATAKVISIVTVVCARVRARLACSC